MKINLIIFGRTGSGKSTIANVISNSDDFKEGHYSVSQTLNHQIGRYQIDDMKYTIVDTCGLADTSLTTKQVLEKLALASLELKNDGINVLVYVINSKLGQSEIDSFNLLVNSGVLFNRNILKNTVVVRTNFANFRSEPDRTQDIQYFRSIDRNQEFGNCPIVHVNNLQSTIEPTLQSRLDSRLRLLLSFRSFAHSPYIPSELANVMDRVSGYLTEEEKVEKEKQRLLQQQREQQEKIRIEQERLRKQQEEIARVKREAEELERKMNALNYIQMQCSGCGKLLIECSNGNVTVNCSMSLGNGLTLQCTHCQRSISLTKDQVNNGPLGRSMRIG
eukprot:gene2841-3531_t